MDFITGLPKSGNKSVIMVVVDRLSSMLIFLVKSGSAKTGVEHMAVLRAVNACCASSFQKKEFLFRSYVRGFAMQP